MSQGIIVFDSDGKYKNEKFPYYRDVILINSLEMKEIIKKKDLLFYLDENFGRKRLVNPKQFEIIKGSVVKSKIHPQLGPGYVKEIMGDNIKVNFPKGKELMGKSEITCHVSTLRIITHIEEVKNEKAKSFK